VSSSRWLARASSGRSSELADTVSTTVGGSVSEIKLRESAEARVPKGKERGGESGIDG